MEIRDGLCKIADEKNMKILLNDRKKTVLVLHELTEGSKEGMACTSGIKEDAARNRQGGKQQ